MNDSVDNINLCASIVNTVYLKNILYLPLYIFRCCIINAEDVEASFSTHPRGIFKLM